MKQNKVLRYFAILLVLCLLTMVMTACETRSSYQNFLNANSAAEESRTATTTTTGENEPGTTTATEPGTTTAEPGTTQTPNTSITTGSGSNKEPVSSGTTANKETNIIQNEIVINGAGSTDVSYAAASGLRSIVSIYASKSGSSVSGGSGVIYRIDEETGSALVITNYHVVSASNSICDTIELYLFGMEYSDYTIPATYVGGSANYDLAVLYVQDSSVLKNAIANGSVAAATIANSETVAAGQSVIAIGNPNSDGISVTTGVVSVDSEYITMTATNSTSQVEFRVIRIDAAVNFGNSGGGLFNTKGELIGIVNAKISSSDVENIGYAIPSNVARAISDNIIDYCFGKTGKTVMRAMLGIEIKTLSVSTVYNDETGMLQIVQEIGVHSVSAGGLGESILKVDDVIKSISINEKKTVITRQHQVIDTMLDARVGDTVSFEIVRGGVTMTVSTTVTSACLTEYA